MQFELSSKHSIHYQLIEGDANKPYLVFLHEGLGCIKMWKSFPQLLCEATGCPGLIYDRLGYGESDPLIEARTINYLHDSAIYELPKLLDELIGGCRYIIIGHSDGGSIGLIHASQQPMLLQGLITEAAHVFVETPTIEGIKLADDAWESGKLKGLTKYHGAKTEQTFKAWSQTWQKPWFAFWNIEYLLPSIEVPVLAIQGKDDQYGSDYQVATMTNKIALAQGLLIEACAHTPHFESQQQVIKAICLFIKKDLAVS